MISIGRGPPEQELWGSPRRRKTRWSQINIYFCLSKIKIKISSMRNKTTEEELETIS